MFTVAVAGFLTSEAAAQYYNPNANAQNYVHKPGLGVSLGAQNNGINPNVGFGYGPVGAGVGAGIGGDGIGVGTNTGIGPLGVAADGGLGHNGLGLRAGAGIGNTGAAFNGGISDGGVGAGANARIFGFGPGASIGVGKRGPGFGANFAFGPLGTLLIGSHRNSYPGAAQTAAHAYPGQKVPYYAPQTYGKKPYYQSAPVQRPHYAAPTSVVPTYSRSVAPTYSRSAAPTYYYSHPQCPQNWIC